MCCCVCDTCVADTCYTKQNNASPREGHPTLPIRVVQGACRGRHSQSNIQTCFMRDMGAAHTSICPSHTTWCRGYWVNTPGHPNFVENVHFHINCRLSVRPLGHPNGLNPTVPRAPFKIPIFDRCAKSVFSLFCRLSVPSLGRPFHHFERQSFQCT